MLLTDVAGNNQRVKVVNNVYATREAAELVRIEWTSSNGSKADLRLSAQTP